jgi:hypothetical protein
MTLLEAITQAHLLAKGKATAPANTSSTYLALAGFANVGQTMWQDEPDVQWDSLRFVAEVVASVSATDTYTIPSTVRELSQKPDDDIYIEHTDGQKTYYELVEPDQLQYYTRAGMKVVARKGTDLIFSIPFTAQDPQFGGSIFIPAYGYVTELSDGADVVVVDEPMWLSMMMAAEYCRTKTSLNYRVDGLIDRANQLMQKMKQNQESQYTTATRPNLTMGRTW